MPTSAGLLPSSNEEKGSSDRHSNIGACNTAGSPPKTDHQTRPTLRNPTPRVVPNVLTTDTLMILSMPAAAQDREDSSLAGEAGSSPREGLGDAIIVTANKRDESIDRVGVSISAFSASMLEDRNIDDAMDLAAVTPGMALAPSTHGTPVYTLRGIGSNADSLGVYPAVSVSMDQGPMPFPVLASHSMYDLERVEVLKGPQGTLFGQNSTGGAINYVAARPTSMLEAGFDLTYGRFNEVHTTAYMSGPVGDNLNMRLAVDAAHRDDWQYSHVHDGTNGEQNYFAGRLTTEWEPTDRLRLYVNLNGSVDRSEPQAQQLLAVVPAIPGFPSVQENAAELAPDDLRAANWSIEDRQGNEFQSPTQAATPEGNRRLFQAIVRADLDLTDTITLTSISTYNHLTQNMSFDVDGSQFELVDSPISDGQIDDFSQEVRIANDGSSGAIRWTLGVNYNYSSVDEYQRITFGDNSLAYGPNNFFHVVDLDNRGRINTYAAFANAEYDISDSLTLKAGIRYTDSNNDNYMCEQDTSEAQQSAELFRAIGELLTGNVVFAPCIPIGPEGVPTDPLEITLAEDNVSWRFGVDYRPTQETMFYANVSRGYKAGSFPVITASAVEGLFPAKQESVTSYEAGLKTWLGADAVQLNAAIFYQDYKDKQIQGTFATELFGNIQRLDNVPKSHIFGVELDFVARPVENLTISGAGSYLEARVDRYQGLSVFGADTDFNGATLPFAPTWTLVGDVDYRIPTSSGGEFFTGFGVSYRTSQAAYIAGDALILPDNGVNRSNTTRPFKMDGYALVDARLGYEFPGDRVSISAWAKNIFDKFNVTNVVAYNDVITRSTGQPRTFGITLSVDWF